MLSNRLKQLRNEKNWTQKEIANKLEIPRGTYAHYEIGKRQPDYDTLINIAKIFNVSIDFLLGNSNERTLVKFYSEEFTDEDLDILKKIKNNIQFTELFKIAKSSSKEDLEQLIKYGKFIILQHECK